MTLFRLDASIRTEGSHSREIADLVESEWRAENPQARIIRRHIGTEPVPATAWAAAVSAAGVDRSALTAEQKRGRRARGLGGRRACCAPMPRSLPFRSTTSASRSTSRAGSIS